MTTTRQALAWARKNSNFMTPRVLSIHSAIKDYFVELSEGEDFDHKPMFGVSVIYWNGEEFTTSHHSFTDLKKLCHSRIAAEEHVTWVIDRLRNS